MGDAIQGLTEDARAIMQVNSAYFRSKVLQSAVEIGLFEFLADGAATAETICDRLGLHPRLVRDFLDALVGLEFLDREAGRYALPEAQRPFLTRAGDYYLGGSIGQHDRKHYRAWTDLTAALRDGQPKSDIKGGTSGFMKLYQSGEAVHRLMNHMDSFNRFVAPRLASCMDWSKYDSFVDIGGARGNVAALLVQAMPDKTGTVFDLPPVKPLFEEHMEVHGTADRIAFFGGDFLVDPIPEADVAIIGHVLHDWAPEDRQRLIDRTYDAVRPGGALLIYDAMIDDERRDAGALLQSLNCRIISIDGSEYTIGECRALVEHAGYRCDDVVNMGTITNDKVVVARKSS